MRNPLKEWACPVCGEATFTFRTYVDWTMKTPTVKVEDLGKPFFCPMCGADWRQRYVFSDEEGAIDG